MYYTEEKAATVKITKQSLRELIKNVPNCGKSP